MEIARYLSRAPVVCATLECWHIGNEEHTLATQTVIAPPSRAGMFIVMTVKEGAEDAILDFLSNFSSLNRAVGFRVDDKLGSIVGIGSKLWDRLFPTLPRPKHLREFQAINGPKHVAPSTPGDILIHLKAPHIDVCFEMAKQIGLALQGLVDYQFELHAFKFFDERDLLGFVDGSQNPEGKDAAAAVLIEDDVPDYVGGSYVVVQKYLHDMAAWEGLSVEEQEKVIGRTKLEDIQLEDLPVNSHVNANTIVLPDGTQKEILRENMPFGNVSQNEYGTFYIAYSNDPAVQEIMLHRMFIGDPPGNTDRILDFSTAVTGSMFFVPPLGFLNNTPGVPPAPTVTNAQMAQFERDWENGTKQVSPSPSPQTIGAEGASPTGAATRNGGGAGEPGDAKSSGNLRIGSLWGKSSTPSS